MKVVATINNQFNNCNENIIIDNAFDIGLIIPLIANALTHHLKLYKLKISSRKDINIRLLVNESQLGKHKPEDAETNLERIIFVCNQFESHGMVLNFEIVAVDSMPFKSHESVNSFWSFKQKWIGDENKIMIKKSNDIGFNQFGVNTRNIDLSFAYEYAEENRLDIFEFDYSTRFEEIIENAIHSKFAVSEMSGITLLVTYSECPLYICTDGPWQINMFGKNIPITWGNGNLTTSSRIDHIHNGVIEQKFFDKLIQQIPDYDKTRLDK